MIVKLGTYLYQMTLQTIGLHLPSQLERTGLKLC